MSWRRQVLINECNYQRESISPPAPHPRRAPLRCTAPPRRLQRSLPARRAAAARTPATRRTPRATRCARRRSERTTLGIPVRGLMALQRLAPSLVACDVCCFDVVSEVSEKQHMRVSMTLQGYRCHAAGIVLPLPLHIRPASEALISSPTYATLQAAHRAARRSRRTSLRPRTAALRPVEPPPKAPPRRPPWALGARAHGVWRRRRQAPRPLRPRQRRLPRARGGRRQGSSRAIGPAGHRLGGDASMLLNGCRLALQKCSHL